MNGSLHCASLREASVAMTEFGLSVIPTGAKRSGGTCS
jgi:hypothetical protein